jgi:hypothetical protein
MRTVELVRSTLCLVTVIATGLTLPASATSPIYRCVKNGQTVLTDKPCDGSANVLPSAIPAASSPAAVANPIPAPQSVVGDWRGQTQYQGTQNGQHMDDAHTVVPLVLTFSADGKVSGSSPDNGCQLLGLWAPGSTPRLFPLDITLSNCRFAGFNRRYSGNLIATFPEQSAQFMLQAYDAIVPGKPMRLYDVKATLRR